MRSKYGARQSAVSWWCAAIHQMSIQHDYDTSSVVLCAQRHQCVPFTTERTLRPFTKLVNGPRRRWIVGAIHEGTMGPDLGEGGEKGLVTEPRVRPSPSANET